MKKTCSILVLIFFASCVWAQKSEVSEALEKFDDGIHPALSVHIYESSVDAIKKEWKSKMKSYKYEKISNKDEIIAENIVIPEISSDPIRVIAKVDPIQDKESKLLVTFYQNGVFLSSNASNIAAYEAAKRILYEFARKITRDAIDESLHKEERNLDKLKEEQKELEEMNAELKKSIETYKSKIQKAEEDLISNKSNQEKKKAEMERQAKLVEEYFLKAKNAK